MCSRLGGGRSGQLAAAVFWTSGRDWASLVSLLCPEPQEFGAEISKATQDPEKEMESTRAFGSSSSCCQALRQKVCIFLFGVAAADTLHVCFSSLPRPQLKDSSW